MGPDEGIQPEEEDRIRPAKRRVSNANQNDGCRPKLCHSNVQSCVGRSDCGLGFDA